jgi:predicted Zn-dependent peptidase
LASISSELNNPNAIAGRVLMPLLYGAGHPYGIPQSGSGDPAAVRKISRADLVAAHKRWIRPDNAKILITGSTSMAEVMPHLERSFGTWKAPAAAKGVKSFKAKIPAAKQRIVLVDRPKSPQSVIAAGQVLDAKGVDDLVVLQAANEVFGASFLSRINMNLRETKGWSYGVRSSIAEHNESAPFRITAPVQADKTGASITELLSDLNAFLGPKGVTPAERTRTVNGNVRGLPGSFETSVSVLTGLANIVRYGRPDDYYETLPSKYTAMTEAAMDAAARAKIDPKKLIFVVVGDAAVVKPQLESLGMPVEVVAAPKID